MRGHSKTVTNTKTRKCNDKNNLIVHYKMIKHLSKLIDCRSKFLMLLIHSKQIILILLLKPTREKNFKMYYLTKLFAFTQIYFQINTNPSSALNKEK